MDNGHGWIRDPLDVPQKFAARTTSRNIERENRAAMANTEAGWDNFVDQWIREALASQTGQLLRALSDSVSISATAGIRPVEFFGVYRGGWNHALGVLTRDHSVSVSDFANWSRPAVVCDPLYDPPGTRGFWRRGIRACFRCETVTSSWFQRRPRKMQDNARVARNAHRSGLSD